MSDFDIEKFVENFEAEPSLSQLDLKKSQLLDISKFYKLNVKQSSRKAEIKQILVQFLVDEDILPESDLKHLAALHAGDGIELQKLQFEHELKLKELELSQLRAHLQYKEIELKSKNA